MKTNTRAFALVALLAAAPAFAQVYHYFPPPGASYSTTAGDAGGSLLTLNDTLKIKDLLTPAFPGVDISTLNGINYQGDSGVTLAFDNAGGGIFATTGINQYLVGLANGLLFQFDGSGNFLYQGPQPGVDVSQRVQNTSTGANSYAVGGLTQDQTGAGCGLYSELAAGVTHLPNQIGAFTGASYPLGANYIVCQGGGKPMSIGIGGQEALRIDGTTAGLTVGAPTGGQKGTGTVNAINLYVQGVAVAAPLTGTSASIGGGALAAGACASTATTVTGAAVGNAVVATPNTYPGDPAFWKAYVSAANTVTTLICESIAATPTASTYNLRVIP